MNLKRLKYVDELKHPNCNPSSRVMGGVRVRVILKKSLNYFAFSFLSLKNEGTTMEPLIYNPFLNIY